MAACRLSAHDQAGSEEELDPQRLAVARRFPGTANGDRHITLTASTRTGEHSVRDAPGHWLSQHQCKGHAQNVQIRDSSRLDQPRTDERAERRFALTLRSRSVTALGTVVFSGHRLSAWRLWPPGGVAASGADYRAAPAI